MTALLVEVEAPQRSRRRKGCSTCEHVPSIQKRRVGIPKVYPRNLGTDHLIETFQRHPWLEEMPVSALAQSLRDAVVSNA